MRALPEALLSVLLLAPARLGAQPREISVAGALDARLPIQMTFSISAGRVTGSYFYDRLRKPIALRGTVAADGAIVLDELDAKGAAAAQFRGMLAAGDRFEGRWYKRGEAKGLPFALAPAVPASSGWAGEWTRAGSALHDTTTLTISAARAADLDFVLDGQSGGHIDQISGTATVQGGHASWSDQDLGCRLDFSLSGETIGVDASACPIGPGGVQWGGSFGKGESPGPLHRRKTWGWWTRPRTRSWSASRATSTGCSTPASNSWRRTRTSTVSVPRCAREVSAGCSPRWRRS